MTFLCRNTKTSLHEFILCAGKIMIRDNRRKSNLMWQTEKHRAELGPAAYFVFVFISILVKRVTNICDNHKYTFYTQANAAPVSFNFECFNHCAQLSLRHCHKSEYSLFKSLRSELQLYGSSTWNSQTPRGLHTDGEVLIFTRTEPSGDHPVATFKSSH